MTFSQRHLPCATALAIAVLLVNKDLFAAAVTGVVRDQGKARPTNGLSGAKVQLRPAQGKLTDIVLTNTDGEYRVNDIADGEYTVVVTKIGYIPRPHASTKVRVKKDVEAGDVLLMKAYADDEYYAKVASAILARVSSAPEDKRRNALTAEWTVLRSDNLPPESKALLAIHLDREYARAQEVIPDLKDYLTARPGDIAKAQASFEDAVIGKISFPARNSFVDMKLGGPIVADLILFNANKAEEEGTRKFFLKQFEVKWEGTEALKLFQDFHEGELESRLRSRPQ